MSRTRWNRLEELFARAVQLDGEGRRRFLDTAAGDDPELRQEIAKLLAADTTGDDFLGRAVSVEAASLYHDIAPRLAGRRLGPWQIEDRLGEGGMSTVYRARRADQQFEMRVAVKLMKWGLDSDEMRHRFDVERRILACLEHPNIARLLDAGSTEDALPYFVMEYVDGIAIDRYCDLHQLGIDDRLRLFETVCTAVDYAHRNLIVHRDLKPGNILVTAEGVPKLLDFGIAKLLTTGDDRHTAPTRFLLTPGFASPEQFRGSTGVGSGITTASDVYSLGVLLYILLCGRRPYLLAGLSPNEAEQLVCERPPEAPSRVLLTPPEDGQVAIVAAAEVRDLKPGQLRKRLEGDLDTIVAKALRKEPERRYSSASQLAADLERHRRGLPVSARPETLVYRAGKFLRRHRLAVAVAAVAVVLALGFVAALVVQSVRLARERDVAERERERVERVSQFMAGIFQGTAESFQGTADNVILTEQLTVPDLLDHGASRAYTELAEEPEILYRVLEGIARRLHQMGLNDRAVPLWRDALDLQRGTLGADHPEIAESLNRLAITYAELGQYAEAESLFRETLDLRRRILGPEHLQVANSVNNLALVRHDRGDYRGAEALYQESLALYEHLFGADDLALAPTLDNLGLLLFDLGAYAEAEPILRQSMDLRRRHLGDQHPDLAHSLMLLGATRSRLPAANDGEALLRQAVVLQREQLGSQHPEVPRALQRLAEAVFRRGDLAEAKQLHGEALALRREQLGNGHPEVAASLTGLAHVLEASGDRPAAESHFRDALGLYRSALSPSHPELADAAAGLGALLLEAGALDTARPLLREALEIRRQALLPGDARIVEVEELLRRSDDEASPAL